MKTFRISAVIAMAQIVAAAAAFAQTNFTVTTPGGATFPYFFIVSGPGVPATQCPPINVRAGNTYTFSISTTPGFHPVDIVSNVTFPVINGAYSGASPQTITSGTITLTIPATNFPSTLFYICDIHGFHGQINVSAPATPPAPPQNIIISILVQPTNVVVTSSGTNTTYVLVPEFNSNLVTGSWLSVPSFTNTFSDGTNTTMFGRLDAICGSNVFLRISQRPPQ